MANITSLIAPQNIWPWLLAAAGGVALAVLGMLVWLMMRASRQRDPLSRKESTLSLAQQRSIERDIAGLMNDLADMARDVGRELDARSARLEQLIREADERLGKIETKSNPPAEPASAAEEQHDPRHVEVYTLADQ